MSLPEPDRADARRPLPRGNPRAARRASPPARPAREFARGRRRRARPASSGWSATARPTTPPRTASTPSACWPVGPRSATRSASPSTTAPPLDLSGSTVVALSQSGRTPDVLEYVTRARAGRVHGRRHERPRVRAGGRGRRGAAARGRRRARGRRDEDLREHAGGAGAARRRARRPRRRDRRRARPHRRRARGSTCRRSSARRPRSPSLRLGRTDVRDRPRPRVRDRARDRAEAARDLRRSPPSR